jgi:sialic acid synthase SpsE
MVDRTRELEAALGTGVKKVENNEMETVVLQRRSARARRDIRAGERLGTENIEFLRPCPIDAVTPLQFAMVKNPVAAQALAKGDYLRWHTLKMQ